MALPKARLLEHNFPVHGLRTLPRSVLLHDWGPKFQRKPFFGAKLLENPSGHGRPRRKSWTSAPKGVCSCGPVMGRNF